MEKLDNDKNPLSPPYQGDKTYTFTSKSRWHLVRDYDLVTSNSFVGAFMVMAVLALAAVLLVVFVSTVGPIIGLTVAIVGLTVGLLNLLVFGYTYFPFVPVSHSVAEILKRGEGNVASAVSFDLLRALGAGAAGANTKEDLDKSVEELFQSSFFDFLVRRLQLDRAKLVTAVRESVMQQLTWEEFAERMLKVAAALGQERIEPEHAIGAMLMHPNFKVDLRRLNLTESDILFALWWSAEYRREVIAKRRWWDESRLLSVSGIGLAWASGFTPLVDRFARLPQGTYWDDVIYGHEGKVRELINTLARQRQSNVLLVGDPGAGCIGIIRQLARQIINNTAHAALRGERVLYINVGELAAQGSTGAGQMAFVSLALREMERSGNIIAVLDGLSSVLGRAGEQKVDLTDMLLPFLSSRTVRVVVIVSTEEYHLRLKTNGELMNYFEVVLVPSLSEEATMKRVAVIVPLIEKKTKLFIPQATIKVLMKDTATVLPHIPYPERAFDFLEEAVVLAQGERARTLEPRHIHTLIARKLGINLGILEEGEKERLLDLSQLMHRRLVDQEEAVKQVTHALVRARSEVGSKKRPIGTFLFLGPTGVGKTETAKTLAEVYFGAENYMVRLDMSEFQGVGGVASLIGSSQNPVGRLTSLIADHPFSVVLLDEFEKAAVEVQQLFLQVFDEGHLTDASGRMFSFLHTIIIATSNAGSELIRQSVKDGHVPAGFGETLKDYILSHNIFRPELLNRFDAVVTFSPLSVDHIRKIAELMLRALNQRLDAEHGVTIEVTSELIDYLVEIGYNPEFGARPMARAIQDTVEYVMAQKIIKGEIKPGSKLTLTPELLRAARAQE